MLRLVIGLALFFGAAICADIVVSCGGVRACFWIASKLRKEGGR